MAKLRIGIADLFYGRPLAWGFLRGQYSEVASSELYPHRRVAPLLLEGVLDAALVSSLDVGSDPDLCIVPDLCVAAAGASRSVRVVSDRPFCELETLYVGDASRTASVLSALVLGELAGRPLTVSTSRPQRTPVAEVREGVAALVAPAESLDVTEAWRRISGCPAVLALWAIRPGLDPAEISFYFKSSLRFGINALDHLVREAAAEIDLPADGVFEHFSDELTYVLGRDEHKGLEALAARAKEAGLMECSQVAM